MQGLISEAERRRVADLLTGSKHVMQGGYELSDSGDLQVPIKPYQRQRSVKTVHYERMQQGLTVDKDALCKAAGWIPKGL